MCGIVGVILTTAHLDHSTRAVPDEYLKAMCQKCHLAYDTDQRLTTKLYNRGAQMFRREEFQA